MEGTLQPLSLANEVNIKVQSMNSFMYSIPHDLSLSHAWKIVETVIVCTYGENKECEKGM